MMFHPYDPSPAPGARAGESPAHDEDDAIDRAYGLLVTQGPSTTQAGNVIAHIVGLGAAEHGWSLREVKYLVAIRSMVVAGFIES